jgi:Histidine kinase
MLADAIEAGWRRLPPALRQVLPGAALWSVVVAAAEGAVLDDRRASPSFWLLDWCVPGWCVVGCVQLALARRAQRQGRYGPVLVGGPLVAVVWSMLLSGVALARSVEGFSPVRTLEGGLSLGLYNLWVNLFYGGLLVAVYLFASRAERTRSLLQSAAIARGRTAALRDRQELESLQQNVDPALLLDVMADIERGYRESPGRADELLGRLVDFLRAAMPGLKGRVSTLDGELQLAGAYVELQAARGLDTGWTIERPTELPRLPFPGQLLMPLLTLAAPHSRPTLRVEAAGDRIRLHAAGLGRAFPADFVQHAQVALASLPGGRPTLAIADDGSLQLAMPRKPSPEKGAEDEDR